MKKVKTRAALYIRLSREDENLGPSQSVTNQESLLRAYARENGFSVRDCYIDDGWSGMNFDRPAFRRMMADADSGKFDVIITKDLSRLGRDYVKIGQYLEHDFPEKGIRYLSVLDGIDTGRESALNDVVPFRAILNDMYAKDISGKIRSVKHHKQRQGLFIGSKALYGYRRRPDCPNAWMVDEEAACVVREVFERAKRGQSPKGIAEALNERGVPPPYRYAGLSVPDGRIYSGKWSGERISEMLANEAYTGSMVQAKRTRISYKIKKCVRRDPEDWAIVPGTHEAIVDRVTFDEVRRIASLRKRQRSRTYDYPLKSIVYCTECGMRMGAVCRRNAAGEDKLYLICRGHQKDRSLCSPHCISEDRLMQALREILRPRMEAVLSGENFRCLWEQMRESSCAESHSERMIRVRERIGRAMSLAYEDRSGGLLSESDFAKLREHWRRELEEAQKACEGRAFPDLSKKTVQEWTCLLLNGKIIWETLVEKIECSRDGDVLIRFRFSDPFLE